MKIINFFFPSFDSTLAVNNNEHKIEEKIDLLK